MKCKALIVSAITYAFLRACPFLQFQRTSGGRTQKRSCKSNQVEHLLRVALVIHTNVHIIKGCFRLQVLRDAGSLYSSPSLPRKKTLASTRTLTPLHFAQLFLS